MNGIINYYNIMGNENNTGGDIGGGIIENITIGGTNYTVHIFNESSSFYNNIPLEIEYLVVAGGGASYLGSDLAGGGGGAGGLKHTFGSPINLPVGSYDMIIGKGGLPSTMAGNSVFANGSTFSNIVYGGGNAVNNSPISKNGGSGAGGYIRSSVYRNSLVTHTPGTGISGQGNNGGNGYGRLLPPVSDGVYDYQIAGGAGGGGAGGVGGSATSTSGGDGGVGIDLSAYLTTNYGDSGYFAGGGGGCTQNTSTKQLWWGTSIGVGANTGGGARGRFGNGAGDDGIIIIRYKTPE